MVSYIKKVVDGAEYFRATPVRSKVGFFWSEVGAALMFAACIVALVAFAAFV